MAKLLFEKLEAFRKQKGLSILAICRQMGVYNHHLSPMEKIREYHRGLSTHHSNFLAGSKSSPYNIKNKDDPEVVPLRCRYCCYWHCLFLSRGLQP